MLQETLVARVSELDTLLDAAELEDFSLVNEASITDVAREMLARAEWP
jgi:hypothetical protein